MILYPLPQLFLILRGYVIQTKSITEGGKMRLFTSSLWKFPKNKHSLTASLFCSLLWGFNFELITLKNYNGVVWHRQRSKETIARLISRSRMFLIPYLMKSSLPRQIFQSLGPTNVASSYWTNWFVSLIRTFCSWSSKFRPVVTPENIHWLCHVTFELFAVASEKRLSHRLPRPS